MNTWQGYNSDEDRRRPDDSRQQESPTFNVNGVPIRGVTSFSITPARQISTTPVRAFSGPPEADEFHADIAAWLKGNNDA